MKDQNLRVRIFKMIWNWSIIRSYRYLIKKKEGRNLINLSDTLKKKNNQNVDTILILIEANIVEGC